MLRALCWHAWHVVLEEVVLLTCICMFVPDEHKLPAAFGLVLPNDAEGHMLHVRQQLLKGDLTQSQDVICRGRCTDDNKARLLRKGQEPLGSTLEPALLQLPEDLLFKKRLHLLQNAKVYAYAVEANLESSAGQPPYKALSCSCNDECLSSML